MGAWDENPFGNDTACDWAADVVDGGSVSMVRETLGEAAGIDFDELDSSLAEEALAAAEIVAPPPVGLDRATPTTRPRSTGPRVSPNSPTSRRSPWRAGWSTE